MSSHNVYFKDIEVGNKIYFLSYHTRKEYLFRKINSSQLQHLKTNEIKNIYYPDSAYWSTLDYQIIITKPIKNIPKEDI